MGVTSSLWGNGPRALADKRPDFLSKQPVPGGAPTAEADFQALFGDRAVRQAGAKGKGYTARSNTGKGKGGGSKNKSSWGWGSSWWGQRRQDEFKQDDDGNRCAVEVLDAVA